MDKRTTGSAMNTFAEEAGLVISPCDKDLASVNSFGLGRALLKGKRPQEFNASIKCHEMIYVKICDLFMLPLRNHKLSMAGNQRILLRKYCGSGAAPAALRPKHLFQHAIVVRKN